MSEEAEIKQEDVDEVINEVMDNKRQRVSFKEEEKLKESTDPLVDDVVRNMTSVIETVKNPEYVEALNVTLERLKNKDQDPTENPLNLGKKEVSKEGQIIDTQIAQTLIGLNESTKKMEGLDPSQVESMGEDMMKQMMKQFEKIGESNDFNKVMDGMMNQLLSKEVMYEPMKLICDEFPTWLAINQTKMDIETYERYGRMYQYYQQIVYVYESEPGNFQRLTELFEDMQDCGQAPADIIKKLAPELEFSEDGLPKFPNLGATQQTTNGFPTNIPAMQGCIII